ncbi:hypothetical protein K458DRAFT_427635 [Lentithecium fluviatile CBS 122367]|uniref:Uncharacterized protein n=1 Tax=Lentithecium fluviatile CBS 122367 TaxID=1168545 RepID=A0A6G1JH81_9PLEO|nr:hypothetical protein K458DRAFT_427635 [Lentithecium fluviatile CBS 122367]
MGAVVSCIQSIFRTIGNCIMAIVNAIAAACKAVINAIVSLFGIIISCLTVAREAELGRLGLLRVAGADGE